MALASAATTTFMRSSRRWLTDSEHSICSIDCLHPGDNSEMANVHLAQLNIGRVRAPLEDPIMQGFVDRLADLNALADASPGFVWRLQTDAGNATYFRP